MPLREITETDGTVWQVYDVNPEGSLRVVGDGLHQGWLVFESDRHKCRIAPIPAGWDRLTDDDLVALKRTATPALKTKLASPLE